MTVPNRIQGGIWGALIGDALGVPVEFIPREERLHDPVQEMRGYGTHDQPPGTWSDDGSLLLCTVEALCGEYHPRQLADLFLAWRERGYWTAHGELFDIGIATCAALSRIRRGVPPEAAGGDGEHDNGNGSLMRILPVALRYASQPVADMLTKAHRISALTHRHPRSQLACGLYCCAARGLLAGLSPDAAYRAMIEDGYRHYRGTPLDSELAAFARIFSGRLGDEEPDAIHASGYVVRTLEAALWCLLTAGSFEDTVLRAVNLGDDTDTVGCVAGGLAGLCYPDQAANHPWRAQLAGAADIAPLLEEFTLACTGNAGMPPREVSVARRM